MIRWTDTKRKTECAVSELEKKSADLAHSQRNYVRQYTTKKRKRKKNRIIGKETKKRKAIKDEQSVEQREVPSTWECVLSNNNKKIDEINTTKLRKKKIKKEINWNRQWK